MQHPGAIPSFRFPAEGRVEDASLADFPLEKRILVVLAQQPWSSAGNLARRLEYSVADIHDACGELGRKKRVAGRDLWARLGFNVGMCWPGRVSCT